MANQGIFIVLEGADGSGKSTQFKLLAERLRAVGYDVEVFKFPQYDKPSSHFIKKYLNGEYGSAESISPYTASMFYALDRYEAAPNIRSALQKGKIVLSDRYVGSNMAHQGGKFTNSGEQRGFFIWEDGLEFQMLGVPRPNINIFLRVPVEISLQLMDRDSRTNRGYTTETHDQHEKNVEHLKNSVATYDTLCKLFPKDFKAIDCAPKGKLISIADINNEIWNEIKPILPDKPPHKAHDVVVKLGDTDNAATRNEEPAEIASEQREQQKIAPADDLDIEIKKVSLLAAGKLELFPGIKTEITDIRWTADGTYDFYTPVELPKKALTGYKKSFERLAALYGRINDEIGKSSGKDMLQAGLNPLIPLAALVNLKISGSSSAVSMLITSLRFSPLPEVRWLAEQVHAAARRLEPQKFPDTRNTRNVMDGTNNVLYELAASRAEKDVPRQDEPVSLREITPRNEFLLLPDALYSYSRLSQEELFENIEAWSYTQKKDAIAAVLEAENNALLDVRYRWNIITDSSTFTALKHSLNIQSFQVQAATPEYGYEVPSIFERLGLDELYIEYFNVSLRLYTYINEYKNTALSEYSLLSGHKRRWQFTTNPKMHKLGTAKHNDTSVQAILDQMIEKISERHSLIGDYLMRKAPEAPVEKAKDPSEEKSDNIKKVTSRRRRRSRKSKK